MWCPAIYSFCPIAGDREIIIDGVLCGKVFDRERRGTSCALEEGEKKSGWVGHRQESRAFEGACTREGKKKFAAEIFKERGGL